MVLPALHVAGADHRGFGILYLKTGGFFLVVFHKNASFWGVFPSKGATYIFLFPFSGVCGKMLTEEVLTHRNGGLHNEESYF